MTADDVIRVLFRLEAAGVAVSVEGGWGVDALFGEQTREHGDLDLAVARSDCTRAEHALAGLGFRHNETAWPGLPARLVLSDRDGREVDFHPLVFDADGNGWQQLADDGGGYIHPADAVWHEGWINGRRVHCISPELQLTFHLGYAWQERDRLDMRRLAVTFGTPLPPDA